MGLIFSLLCSLLAAQETGGAISGRVTDASGAAVPGVELVATHAATGTVNRTVSSHEGVYAFPNLPIGVYDLAASRAGFKKAVRKGLELHVSEHLVVAMALEVGDLAQEVSVTGAAVAVETDSGDGGALISGEQVRDLQLNGRSFMTLLELVPGVASSMGDRMDPNSSPNVSINGARSTGNNFNLDGGNNSDVIVGGSAQNTYVSVESIAEFTAVTTPYSAEYGRAGFAQINVVTRGGAKQYHGSLYEFFRNDALDANDYFSHRVLPLRLNNFGYSISGPVPLGYNRGRDKTFFFFNQEFNRIRMCPSAVNTTVPIAALKRGDFSSLGAGRDGVFGTADDPVIDPVSKLGFPGGIIPASRIDPNAQKLLGLYPAPNFVGPGTINFTSAAASMQNWQEEVARIDHHFSSSFNMYARAIIDTTFVRNPYGGSGTTGAYTPFPGIAQTQSDRPGKNVVVNASHIIRPTLVNQANFAFARRYFDMFATAETASRSKLGISIPELFPENKGDIIPAISLSNYAALNVRGAGHKELMTFEWADTVSKVWGRHILKAGGYYFYGGNREQNFAPQTNGGFSFDTSYSKHSVANMLLGLPAGYSEVDKTVWTDERFASIEAFVQDDFKARRNLTFNFGLRWVTYLTPQDRNHVQANFVPALWKASGAPRLDASGMLVAGTGDPLNGMILAGQNSPYGNKVTGNNTNLLGPRFGFAWAPFEDRKTSLRGGYGIFYTRPMLGTYLDSGLSNPPFARSVTLLNPLLQNLGVGTSPASAPVSLIMIGLPMLAPTMQQFSFGVQRELFGRTVLEVNYVHSHGTHLMRPVNINTPTPGVLGAAPGNRINAYRPYPGYTSISDRQSSGSSVYDALQVSFRRRVSKLTVGLAYTFGKSIDDGSSERGGGDTPPNKDNIRAERGPSDFDRTQVLTSNFIWHLPRLARGALDGWQLSGITRMWSGTPFDVAINSDVAGIGATQNQRPNVTADTQGPRTPDQWFNRNAFARPVTGTFGNMGRNSLRGPGVDKWDLALFKNFRMAERINLQFRGEAFNVFNHPSFAGVGSSLSTTATSVNPLTGNFAVITSTRDARVLQAGLKLVF
jgi:hypothetical protein